MDQRLDSLTPELDWKMAQLLREAQDLEVSVEPVIQREVENATFELYRAAGLDRPTLAWCDSPLAMYLSRAIVTLMSTFYSKEENGLPASGSPTYFQGFRDTFCGDNMRFKLRDQPLSDSESVIRTVCSADLWYGLSATQIGVNWRVGSSLDNELERSPLINLIRRSVASVAQPENANRIAIANATWKSAVRASEHLLGYTIPASSNKFNTLSSYRWPFFSGAMQESLRDCGYGQHDMRFLALIELFSAVPEVSQALKTIDSLLQLTRVAGWYLPHAKVCWLSQRPVHYSFDDRGQPHSSTGPAITFPDHFQVYAWHGVLVNEKAILRPHELTVEEIDSETNAEVRRVLIERLGEEKYFQSGETIVIDEDPEVGTLLMKRNHNRQEEPILMVRVENSTVEPDGSRKIYYLRVPPGMETAREAVAWTFGVNYYHPTKET